MPTVVKNVPRASVDLLLEAAALGVATMHEAQGRTGLLDRRLRPIYSSAKICGNALTCEVAPGDNWTIHLAIEEAQPGDVLVVTPTSPCCDGYIGDLIATSLKARGVLGVIIDAGVRDVSELTKMQFPVWSSAVSAQGTVKETLGNVQTSIVCAGVLIRAGDAIIADEDGVCVVPRKTLGSVVTLAKKREAEEASKRDRYARGEISLDVSDMRGRLAAKGISYVEFDD